LVKEFEGLNINNVEIFYKRLVATVRNEKLKAHQEGYMQSIGKELTIPMRKKLQSSLLESGIQWNLNEESTESKQKKDKEPENSFDHFNKTKTTSRNREELIQKGVQAFRKERLSIWFGNYSNSSNLAKDKLKSSFSSDVEIFKSLQKDILETDFEPWRIINQLFWFLENKLSEIQLSEIFKIISEHFDLIVRPKNDSYEKYEWIEKIETTKGQNEELCGFIIWLLNHPESYIKNSVREILLFLVDYEAELVISSLFYEALSEKPISSTLISSEMLKEISNTKPDLIVEYLKKNNAIIKQIEKVNHFSIKANFLDLAINLNKLEFKELYRTLNQSITDNIILVGEVLLDEQFLMPIQKKIDKLNYMNILNKKFCDDLLAKIKEYCSPLTTLEYKKSDKYLKRSFYNERYIEGRYEQMLSYALNVSINPRVDKNNIKEVYKILN
jgi:hypothetical protein